VLHCTGDFLVPDEVTFAVLLRGYGSRSPPDWQSVDAVLTRMKANYGLEPTAGVYRVWVLGGVMQQLLDEQPPRARRSARVHSFHSFHTPFTPTNHNNTVSFNALLEICAKSNDSDRALDVLDRMAGDSVEPNDFTWQLVAKKRTWRSYMAKLFVDGAA
jgi:pentatricopeptide repeat protein